MLGRHVDEVDWMGPGQRQSPEAVQHELHRVIIKRMEYIEENRGFWQRDLKRVVVKRHNVIAWMSRRFPLEQILLRDRNQRAIKFHTDNTAKWKIRSEHERPALAAANVDEDIVATAVRAVREGLVPAGEGIVERRWSDSPIRGNVAIVGVAGAQTYSANESACIHTVPDVEG